jgi:hypothetical protein
LGHPPKQNKLPHPLQNFGVDKTGQSFGGAVKNIGERERGEISNSSGEERMAFLTSKFCDEKFSHSKRRPGWARQGWMWRIVGDFYIVQKSWF